MADKFTTRFYNADRSHAGSLEDDVDYERDLSMREKILESGGKHYIWDQRNSRWIEAEVVKVGSMKKVAGDKPADAGETTHKG